MTTISNITDQLVVLNKTSDRIDSDLISIYDVLSASFKSGVSSTSGILRGAGINSAGHLKDITKASMGAQGTEQLQGVTNFYLKAIRELTQRNFLILQKMLQVMIASSGAKSAATALNVPTVSNPEMPKLSFRETVGSIVKSAAINKIATSFPGMMQASKSGFNKLGTMVTGLSKDSETIDKGSTTLKSLSEAFIAFGDIQWKKVMVGLIAVRMFSSTFATLAKTLGKKSLINSLEKIETMSEKIMGISDKLGTSLTKIGQGFGKMFESVFEGVANGISFLGKANVLKGVGVMALLSVAIGLNAGAFMLFSQVDWASVGLGILMIGAFTVAAMALGALMETGVLELGIIALAALGVALVPFGLAMMMAGKGMDLFGSGIEKMAEGLSNIVSPLMQLAMMGPMLLATAAAIGAVGLALASFGVGQAAGGLMALFGKLTGSSPIDQLEKLAKMGDGLTKTADALDRINGSMKAPTPTQSGEINSLQNSADEIAIQKAASASATGGAAPGSKIANVNSSSTVNSVIVNTTGFPDRNMWLVNAPQF